MKSLRTLIQQNRALALAFLAVFLFCVGIYLYTRWENARFEVQLVQPKPASSPPLETSATPPHTAGGHWHGDEWHAEPHETPGAQKASPGTGLETATPYITAKTPPDDYHGDPLYWIEGMQYETVGLSSGGVGSIPVLPPEKLARYNDASSTWGDNGERLTPEERQRRMIEVLAEGLSHLDTAKLLAEGSYISGHLSHAREYAQRAIAVDPSNFEAYLVRADLLPPAELEAEYRRLVEWKPNSVIALLNLGATVKDDREAIRYLERSAQLDEAYLNYNALVKLSKRYQRVGDYKKALAALKKLQTRSTGSRYWIEQHIDAIEKGEPLILKGGIYR